MFFYESITTLQVGKARHVLYKLCRKPNFIKVFVYSNKAIFYNITRVDTFEGYKEDLKLYAARLASQPQPGEIVA